MRVLEIRIFFGKDTQPIGGVRENTKHWKNSRKAISSQVEGYTPADFEVHETTKNCEIRKETSVEVERHSSRFGGARKHKKTAEFSSQVQRHSSRLEDGQKQKNYRIHKAIWGRVEGHSSHCAGAREAQNCVRS